ncbi:hypothetical protein LTR59_017471 [Friedmanniomyces endolithicus]|nr:hypothetical protein LTR59_017471 [Friedmanniomyces endolithicus]
MTVTMWMIEPAIATLHVYGNSLDLMNAERKFSKLINVIDPLTMTLHNTKVTNNQMRGRWAGWLAWKEYEDTKAGNPSCDGLEGDPDDDDPRVDLHVGELLCEDEPHHSTGSVIVQKSTRLKMQASLDRASSTSLTLYGNGSMQFTGSPCEIPVLYPSLLRP